MLSADKRLDAISKASLVLVLGSKKRLTIVFPSKVLNFDVPSSVAFL